MSTARDALAETRTALIVDWPSRQVPDTLARAGYTVFVKGGPGPDDVTVQEVRGEEVVAVDAHRPEHVDLVYVHRPQDELPGLIALATELGAHTIWRQSGLAGPDMKDPRGCWLPEQESREARALVEAAGLRYIDDVYIADAVPTQ